MKKRYLNNYIIKSKVRGLYWNNNVGWVSLSLATRYSKQEFEKFLYLPCEAIGWVKERK